MVASLTLLPALLRSSAGGSSARALKRAAKAEPEPASAGGAGPTSVQRRPVAGRSSVAAGRAGRARRRPRSGMRLGFADAGNDAPEHDLPAGLRADRRGLRPRLQRAAASWSTEGSAADAAARRTTSGGHRGGRRRRPAAAVDRRRVSTVIAYPAPRRRTRTTDLVNPARRRAAGDARATGARPGRRPDGRRGRLRRRGLRADAAVRRDRVGLSALLLLVVFRSLLIPLKAALLNLLRIGAALGAITLVFQHGWFGEQAGPSRRTCPS